MGLNFVVVDFETANANYNSACSIGIIVISDNKIVDKYYTLIQPPEMEFHPKNISIHGITPTDVVNAPKFDEVWTNISKYFNGDYIVTAYNAVFDMCVLKACLKEYSIEYPNFEYFCSLQLAKKLYKCENHKLSTVCEHLNICLDCAHNALFDAVATSEVLIASVDNLINKSWQGFFCFFSQINWNSFIDVKEVKSLKTKTSKFSNRPNISSISPTTDNLDSSHVFFNKNFVFTGNLTTLDRKEAMQKVVDVGGVLKSSVSKSTNYLVVGIQDKTIIGSDGLSSKERRALELIESGQPIKILSEEEFIKLLA